jgi:hypothetical protein
MNHLKVPPKIQRAEDEDLLPGQRKYDTLITKEIRNFMVAGKVLKLYKKNGDSKEFHCFMTNDMKEILCKRPKATAIKQKWRLPVHQVKEIKYGYDNDSAFAKSKGLFRRSELNFSKNF